MTSSSSVSPAEEDPLDIPVYFTDPLSISKSLRTYNIKNKETSNVDKIVDFDLKTFGLNLRLVRVELININDGREVYSMSENYQDSDTFDEELIQRCCQSVIGLRDAGLYPSIILEKATTDPDEPSMQASLRLMKKHVVYGGQITTSFHDLTSSTTLSNPSTQQRVTINLKTTWTFSWPENEIVGNFPGLKHKDTWQSRIQPAMLHGKMGWIRKGEEGVKQVGFWAALQDKNLIYHRTSTGKFSFKWWGFDEEI